jgi:hypothetical protein
MKISKYLNEDSKGFENDVRMKKYPELEKLAMKLARDLGYEINRKTENLKSDMPYKAQYVLERIIDILQDAV